MFLLKNIDISLISGLLFSFIAIAIVFIVLVVIILSVSLLSKFKFKEKTKEQSTPLVQTSAKKLTMEDIKDIFSVD